MAERKTRVTLREMTTDLTVVLGLAAAMDINYRFWRAFAIGVVVIAIRHIARQEARRG